MSNPIGKIIKILKKADNSFEMDTIHKSGCMLYVIVLMHLKQIVAVKVSSRKHCISKALAVKYLQSTRKKIDDTIMTDKLKREAYILNILMGDQISPSCHELVTVNLKNMDMVFNLKRMDDDKIIRCICDALYHKTELWSKKIKKSCAKKGIKPYGRQKMTIKRLDVAMDVFWRYGKRVADLPPQTKGKSRDKIAEKLEEIERKKAEERQGKKLKERDEGGKFTTQADKGKTRDKVAENLGISGLSLMKSTQDA